MVTINKIYTKSGDKGKTGLGDGSRRLKTDARVVAYGTVDELNATLGMAISSSADMPEDLKSLLMQVQNDLFDLGADLCVPEDAENRSERLRITQSYIDSLESAVDKYNADLSPLKSFILPGGSALASALHFSRTVTRRAERECLTLLQQEEANSLCLIYLNRLSDLLFVLARFVNDGGEADILWQPGKR